MKVERLCAYVRARVVVTATHCWYSTVTVLQTVGIVLIKLLLIKLLQLQTVGIVLLQGDKLLI